MYRKKKSLTKCWLQIFQGELIYVLKHKKLFDQKHESCKKIISVNLYVLVHCVIRF
jgi:hypothetical protein